MSKVSVGCSVSSGMDGIMGLKIVGEVCVCVCVWAYRILSSLLD